MSTLASFTECIALLMKAPRDAKEIMDLMGINNPDRIQEWMRTLRAEGLVYIAGWRPTKGRAAPIYGWQPSICCNEDVPNPYAISAAARDKAIVERLAAGETAKQIAETIGMHAVSVRRIAHRRSFNPGRFA